MSPRLVGSLVGIMLVLATGACSVGAQERRLPTSMAEVQLSFAPVVKQVVPAVVNIQASRKVVARDEPFLSDPLMQFFFGGRRPQPQRPDRVENALGSGVILRADGVVVTNSHVIEDADQITVILADRRQFEAKLLSRDPRSDLAFLKIDPHGANLPALALGDSDRLEVGDLVLAVGNPFGIGQTVTSGIVSATNRTAEGLDRDVSFIQTDAAINPGNSGGALVGLDGRLIGINTAIFSRSGGSIGIGFAIPANLVKARLASLGNGAKQASNPWLGAQTQAVDAAIAESIGLERPRGVVIGKVYPGAAADRAGLAAGDVVTEVDGLPVDDPASLGYRLALQPLGTDARLVVLRKGKERTLDLPRVAAPDRPAPDVTRFGRGQPLAGATVANMSPAFNETLGIDPFETGVLVTEVQPNSRAAYLDLDPGDIIVGVSGNEVSTVDELQAALPRPGRTFELAVRSGGQLYRIRVGS